MIQNKDELRSRVEAKRAELQARLASAKADLQRGSRERVEEIEAKLSDLHDALKGGWEQLTDATLRRLNDFLREK